jgi:hypothetical protein
MSWGAPWIWEKSKGDGFAFLPKILGACGGGTFWFPGFVPAIGFVKFVFKFELGDEGGTEKVKGDPEALFGESLTNFQRKLDGCALGSLLRYVIGVPST